MTGPVLVLPGGKNGAQQVGVLGGNIQHRFLAGRQVVRLDVVIVGKLAGKERTGCRSCGSTDEATRSDR